MHYLSVQATYFLERIDMKPTRQRIAIGLLALAILGNGPAGFAADSSETATATMSAPAPAAASKEEHVRSSASQMLNKRRRLLDKQAIAANDEIFHAIMDLQKKDSKGAFKELEKADGELNVIMARDPHLKMVAIDVRAGVVDNVRAGINSGVVNNGAVSNRVESSPGSSFAIKRAVKDVQSMLDEGQIQSARVLLDTLVSEMRIYTDYLPLEFYPDAIKRASKQIQESKPQLAETTLADAMSSIVTTEEVIPLPPIKAEGDVLDAEKLLAKNEVKNKDQALALLKSADDHLANAAALGYGKYQDIRDEIASIQSKIQGGTAKPDLFQRVKNLFHFHHPLS